MSEVRHLQLLVWLLDRVEAADAEPELVASLERVGTDVDGRDGTDGSAAQSSSEADIASEVSSVRKPPAAAGRSVSVGTAARTAGG